MDTSSGLAPFYLKQIEIGQDVVTEPVKFDLEQYIANYRGRTRLRRLFLVGGYSTFLGPDALKAAAVEAKRGKDVDLYETAVRLLREVQPNDPAAERDLAWIERTNRANKGETDRLESELKSYKNNLIKESIRMGNEDLGNHYHAIGELSEAVKAYARMRDYCQTSSHVSQMTIKMIVVGVESQQWTMVQSNMPKLLNLPRSPEEEKQVQPIISSLNGLMKLANGEYRDAATNFMAIDLSLGEKFNEVITLNDIAIYGGLCALASMTRSELRSSVLENSNFRAFLELEPHIRQAITLFCNSKFGQCLEVLQSFKPDYLLDLHLRPHIYRICDIVKRKSIVQYFVPFNCVSVVAMANAFGFTETAMEEGLIGMIAHGELEARVDMQNRLLLARERNLRAELHKQAMQTSKEYENMARLRLMRMKIVRANLVVKGPMNMDIGALTGKETWRASQYS